MISEMKKLRENVRFPLDVPVLILMLFPEVKSPRNRLMLDNILPGISPFIKMNGAFL